MSYRTLLLHLNDDPRCDARTQVAIRLAKSLDSHLAGLAPTGLVDVPLAIGPTLGDFAAMAADALRDRAEKCVQRFRERCQAARVSSFEGRIEEMDEARALVRNAHCSDLAIVSQADPTASSHRAAQALVEEVVLESARPTLIVPYAAAVETVGRCVMVAWDDSRESARAVQDALPLLRRAERVRVIAWREAGMLPDEGVSHSLETLRGWLGRHGISADAHEEPATIPIDEAMLSRAADVGADLIVMGAYGHARWTERMLGGATRGLLASMTVPVLMSH